MILLTHFRLIILITYLLRKNFYSKSCVLEPVFGLHKLWFSVQRNWFFFRCDYGGIQRKLPVRQGWISRRQIPKTFQNFSERTSGPLPWSFRRNFKRKPRSGPRSIGTLHIQILPEAHVSRTGVRYASGTRIQIGISVFCLFKFQGKTNWNLAGWQLRFRNCWW